jgi:hypothetical protein
MKNPGRLADFPKEVWDKIQWERAERTRKWRIRGVI